MRAVPPLSRQRSLIHIKAGFHGHALSVAIHAGVARRTTRRAVAVGAGAAVAGAHYGSSCVQVVDAYGRVVMRC